MYATVEGKGEKQETCPCFKKVLQAQVAVVDKRWLVLSLTWLGLKGALGVAGGCQRQ